MFFKKVKETPICYFRKVNFLIPFFEEKYEEIENCENIYIEKEDIEELLNRCNKVLADHSLAEKLLPTTSGFFFGNVEYNEYYYEDVANVAKYCKEVLLLEFDNLDDDEEIVFRAWW